MRVAVAVLLAGVALASPATVGAEVIEATLGNGLRVLLLEDHRSPVAAFQVWYRVGSRNERPGATGIAHFLEHMMFKGTPRFGPRYLSRFVERHGGSDNAFTSHDVTTYVTQIAPDRLEELIALEADRMQHLLLDPAAIDSERQVVMEERRTRTEDDPGGQLAEETSAIAFRAHPYGAPVIGWMVDLERLTREQIAAFHRAHYAPNNAIVVAVGDFDTRRTLAAVEGTFGTIPRGPEPPPVLATEPLQAGERRVTVTRGDARLPMVYIAYHVPNFRSEDAPALELLSTVLSGGRASRLYRHLIQERHLALNAGGDYSYFSLDPYLFWFWATPLPGQTPATLEQALVEEMRRLQQEPVSEEELARAKNQIEAGFVFQEDSVASRASLLARFELLGSHRLREDFVPRIRAVTAEQIRVVANRYFSDDRKNVGILRPTS